MLTQPKIELRSPMHYAALRAQVPIPFGDVLGPMWGKVARWLADQGLTPAGPPFIRYLTTDMASKLDIEVGFPVTAALAGDEHISTGAFPAGRFATADYFGDYSGLMEATAALLDWAKTNRVTWQTSIVNGVERWAARIEFYPTDPAAEPDPAKWQTQLAILTV